MLAYPYISSFCTMTAYTHKHMHTRILIPFEDSELTGLNVGINECWSWTRYGRRRRRIAIYNYMLLTHQDNTTTTTGFRPWPVPAPNLTAQNQCWLLLGMLCMWRCCMMLLVKVVCGVCVCVCVLSLIHIWRCRRDPQCRSRWSPYH